MTTNNTNTGTPAASTSATPAAAAATPEVSSTTLVSSGGGAPDFTAAPNAEASDASVDITPQGDVPAVETTTAAPETYADFVMPPGMTMDAQAAEKFIPLFKELGLSQEQAQKFVTTQAELVKASVEAQGKAFTKQVEAWAAATKSDSEIGGAALEQNIALARIGLAKVGTPALHNLLNESGLSRHPEFVRAWSKVGKLFSEDNPGSRTAAATPKMTPEQIMYPDAKS